MLPIIFLFFPILLFGLNLQDSYIFRDNDIYANTLSHELNSSIFLFTIPKGYNQYSINAKDISKILKKHNIIAFDDNKIITFKKKLDFNLEELEQKLRDEFIANYPTIEINSLTITPISLVDVNDYELSEIVIQNMGLKSGNFRAIFKKGNQKKSIFLKYDIVANIKVIVITQNIYSDELISGINAEFKSVEFDKIGKGIAGDEIFGKFLSKNYLKAGTILLYNNIKRVPLIKKKSVVKVILNSGSIVAEFEAEALNEGDLGEFLSVKTGDLRIFKAKIIDKNLVEVK